MQYNEGIWPGEIQNLFDRYVLAPPELSFEHEYPWACKKTADELNLLESLPYKDKLKQTDINLYLSSPHYFVDERHKFSTHTIEDLNEFHEKVFIKALEDQELYLENMQHLIMKEIANEKRDLERSRSLTEEQLMSSGVSLLEILQGNVKFLECELRIINSQLIGIKRQLLEGDARLAKIFIESFLTGEAGNHHHHHPEDCGGPEDGSGKCELCGESTDDNGLIKTLCGHSCCLECMNHHLASQHEKKTKWEWQKCQKCFYCSSYCADETWTILNMNGVNKKNSKMDHLIFLLSVKIPADERVLILGERALNFIFSYLQDYGAFGDDELFFLENVKVESYSFFKMSTTKRIVLMPLHHFISEMPLDFSSIRHIVVLAETVPSSRYFKWVRECCAPKVTLHTLYHTALK